MISGVDIVNAIFTFVLTILLIQIFERYAIKFNLADIPNERSSHSKIMPKGGGVAFYLSLMITTIFFYHSFFIHNFGFFIALFLVFLLGLYDDIIESTPKLKFIIIIVATLIMAIMNDLYINSLGFWFGYEIKLPYAIALLFTLFAVSGFTNALNLIDGLDGLAGSISLIILGALFYIGYIYHDEFILILSGLMIFALFAFLLFNWYPASIFMGDSGSLVLGFIISAISVKAINYISDTAILYIAAIPIIDTIIVMTRRTQRGKSPFSPDKSHFHHKLLSLKGNVDSTVQILAAFQVVLSSLGLLLRDKSNIVNLILFIIIMFLFFQLLDDRKKSRDLLIVSKLKNILFKTYRSSTNCSTLRLSIVLLIIVLFVRVYFY